MSLANRRGDLYFLFINMYMKYSAVCLFHAAKVHLLLSFVQQQANPFIQQIPLTSSTHTFIFMYIHTIYMIFLVHKYFTFYRGSQRIRGEVNPLTALKYTFIFMHAIYTLSIQCTKLYDACLYKWYDIFLYHIFNIFEKYIFETYFIYSKYLYVIYIYGPFFQTNILISHLLFIFYIPTQP